jgi:hypothetical protein
MPHFTLPPCSESLAASENKPPLASVGGTTEFMQAAIETTYQSFLYIVCAHAGCLYHLFHGLWNVPFIAMVTISVVPNLHFSMLLTYFIVH